MNDVDVHGFIQLAHIPLTTEELTEIKARPFAHMRAVDLTREQVVVRRRVAQKIWEYLSSKDDQQPAWATAVYAQCPPWAFFVDSNDDSLARRVYGAAQFGKDAIPGCHAVCFVPMFGLGEVNDGPTCDQLRIVDEWPEHLLRRFERWPNGGVFLDPLGFLIVLVARME